MFGSTSKRYLILATLGMTMPCLAGEMPKQFQLGQYIPERAWLYTTTAHNPELAWIDGQWDEVWEAVKKSGLEQDVRDLALAFVPEDKKASAIATIDSLADVAHVAIDCLNAEEIAFSENLAKNDTKYEYAMLFRFKPSEVEQRYQALVEKFKVLGELSDIITVSSGENHGLKTWNFSIRGIEEIDHIPTSGSLFRHNNIVGIVAGEFAIRDVMELLRGKSSVKPIVENEKFKRALEQVPSPEDTLVYFDYSAAMKDIRRLIKASVSDSLDEYTHHQDGAQLDTQQQDQVKHIQKLVDKIMSLADMNEYEITTTHTEGRQQRTHAVTGLRADAMIKPFAQAIYGRKPFDKFDQYIPVNAKSFSMSVNVDFEFLYNMMINMIGEGIPEGDRIVEKITSGFDMIGFDPQRDLFSWLSGETISISIPPAFISPMSGGDEVFMIRVKDTALASSKVESAINFVNTMLQTHGQMLLISPASVDAPGFQQVTHPMVAMFIKPVVGVTDGWLIIGSNAGAVNKCLAVAAGKAPSIMKNKRFQEQGLIPDGPVNSLSFTDTSALGGESAAMVGAISMAVNMASMSILPGLQEAGNNYPGAKAFGETIQRVSAMLSKAGPILIQLDFYSSEATMSTFDGRFSRTETVVTYKSPEELTKTATAKAR